jgi:hypothetical protein
VADKKYYLVRTEWTNGFHHHNPIQAYGLKSMIEFSRTLTNVKDVSYVEITQDEYEDLMYGDDNGRNNQSQAQQEDVPKRSRIKAKSKDSESPRDTSGKRTRTFGSQPSKLLKSTVRNVQKSKKDIQGIDDSGTKKVSKPRRNTRSSQ